MELRWLNRESRDFLTKDYLLPGVTPEQRIEQICDNAVRLLKKPEMKEKFLEVISKGWCSLSTPIWINFGLDRGLPISCFGSYFSDTRFGIVYTQAEIAIMSSYGGGTSAYLGAIRPRGATIKDNGKASGTLSTLSQVDSTIDYWSQGSARRGNFAGYIDIFHPDIEEWVGDDKLGIKTETSTIQSVFYGVCVPDWWLREMEAGDSAKRKLWVKILQRRYETGLPYIFFSDNVNNAAPQWYKDNNLRINASNMCTEILESTSEDESFVCDLLSMNLLHYREWKGTHAVQTMTWLLDAVMEEFVQKSANIPFLEKAHRFAVRQRALGLGALGWHSFLQSEMIPFESMQAKLLNAEIFKYLQQETIKASEDMARELGEPELLKGYGRRNSMLMAIAPTTSSSFILGQVSPSIEVLTSNYFTKGLAKGKYGYRNPFLKKLLKEKGKDAPETWDSILKHDGSVQHLEFLSEHEKSVFKTFLETSQYEIIVQAAQRQKFIDQGQSINLMIHPKTPVKDVNKLVLEAWRLGIKTLYYQLGKSVAQEFGANLLKCVSCEA